MRDTIYSFLEFPIAARCTIFLFIVLVLYCFLGRLGLKVLSLVPWVLSKFAYALYYLLEIPVSALHSSIGGAFGSIDRGLTNCAEWCCSHTKDLHVRMRRSKKIFAGRACVVFLILGTYLLLPMYLKYTENIFIFWHTAYLAIEERIISFILH